MSSNVYILLATLLLGFSLGLVFYARYLDPPCPPCEKIAIQKVKARKGATQCFDFLIQGAATDPAARP